MLVSDYYGVGSPPAAPSSRSMVYAPGQQELFGITDVLTDRPTLIYAAATVGTAVAGGLLLDALVPNPNKFPTGAKGAGATAVSVMTLLSMITFGVLTVRSAMPKM